MKNDPYFKFEVNMLHDDNVMVMMHKIGAALGIGAYTYLLLHLRVQDNYEASCKLSSLSAIAKKCNVEVNVIERILFDYGLFEVDKERQTYRSPYLDKVMKPIEERRKINTENGKKGGRPRKQNKSAETPASKGQKPNESQEKRREENKSITTVVTNSSNTTEPEAPKTAAAVAAVVAVPFQQKSSCIPAPKCPGINHFYLWANKPLSPGFKDINPGLGQRKPRDENLVSFSLPVMN